MRAGGDCGVRGPGEAAARAAGDNRGRRSCVCDRLPSGTGWDDGEEKERESEVRSAKKKGWKRRMGSGVGNRVFGTEKRFWELWFRVLGGF